MISVYIGFCKCLDLTQCARDVCVNLYMWSWWLPFHYVCTHTHAFLGKGQLKPFNYEKSFVFTILIIILNPKF